MPRKPLPRKQKKCAVCEETFEVRITSTKTCCSLSCANKWKRISNPNYKTGFYKGHAVNKGRWQSQETREKLAVSMREQYKTGKRERPIGEKHPGWKPDAKYQAIHVWLRRYKPKPSACQRCSKETKTLDAANISGEYKRDVDDFIYLCRRCHMMEDGRLEKAIERMDSDPRMQ